MDAQRLGIVTSLTIHVGLLSLVLMIPATQMIPTKTFHIMFEQQETFSKEMPTTKSPAKRPGTAPAQNTRRQDVVSAQPQPHDETNRIMTDQKPVMPATRGADIITLTRTGTPGPANAGIPGSEKAGNPSVVETRFGNTGAPSFLRREIPVYPRMARRLGKEGRVILKLLIDRNGQLQHVDVIEGADYGFTEAAVEAVKKSIYAPAHRNGRTVTSRAILQVRFNLK
jgi:protein TonB